MAQVPAVVQVLSLVWELPHALDITTKQNKTKQNIGLHIHSNMDAARDYHTKCNKSEKERQIPYDITYMWNLKYDTNEFIYEIEMDSQT